MILDKGIREREEIMRNFLSSLMFLLTKCWSAGGATPVLALYDFLFVVEFCSQTFICK